MEQGGAQGASGAGYLAELFVSFQGEGAHVGRRHLFCRLAGCAVGCRYCDTPEALVHPESFRIFWPGAAAPESAANPVSAQAAAERLAALAARAAPVAAVAVTGGEPLEQAPFLAELLPRLRHPVLLETAGADVEALERVIGHLAIVSMDLKLGSVGGTRVTLAAQRAFLERVRRAPAVEVYVKAVVNERLAPREWTAGTAMVAEVAAEVPFFVQPESRRRGGLALDWARLERLADEASAAGLRDVRVLPQVHKFLGAR